MNRHCRIGKITRKRDGASISVLRPKDDGSSATTMMKLREDVEKICGLMEGEAAGYAVVMWGRDGGYSRAFRNTHSSPFGRQIARILVSSALALDTIEDVVTDTFNRK